MPGQPRTRAKKARQAVKDALAPARKARKEQAAAKAKLNGEALDYAGYTTDAWNIWKRKFAETGRKDVACAASGITRIATLRREKEDKDFALFCDECRNAAMESLEDEAMRRGRDGWEEPQFWKGELQGYVTKYDSGLLRFMLENGNPTKYKPKKELELSAPADASRTPILNVTLTQRAPAEKPKGKK